MIRLATVEDYDQVKELSKELHKISPYSELTFSKKKFDIWFDLAITDMSKATILVAEEDEKLVGIIGGVITEMTLYDATVTAEAVWYVKPEYRSSWLAIYLFKAYEYWSKEIVKADFCMSGSVSTKDLTKFYKRYGYTHTETAYMKRNI